MNTEEEKYIKRLATFPEQNPNPVIEMDYASGKLIYCNPAADIRFPDLKEKGTSHILFSEIHNELKARKDFICHVNVDDSIFEQKIFFIPDSTIVRIYSNDITEQLQIQQSLSRLATFPEKNPNPVIEGNWETGEITYLNPAAKKQFPDLQKKGSDHPLLSELAKQLHKKSDFNCEVELNNRFYEQKIYFLPKSDLVRLYATDITDQKNIQKKLGRLASFPELNPSPIVELNLQGEITYLNPAFLKVFPDFIDLHKEHPVIKIIFNHFDNLVSGKAESYEEEFKLHDHFFLQKASILREIEVVRVFIVDINEQKKTEAIIAERNKDITDSINYAKKIQEAMLPPEQEFLSYFLDSFIFYQPKDIISGDFYWFTSVGDYRIFTCADCTGHGVPGALMSMIGINTLNTIVNDDKIASPDSALLELDGKVRKALKQDQDHNQKDGMDIALCAFQTQKLILHYAGANRPLILIRNKELQEITPSKFAIGGPYNPNKKFEFHTIQLEKGDSIYLFSDGYTDQFGGPKGKKLTKKRFLEFILEINHMPMALQKYKLQEFLNNWRGNIEQVDDICVMGMKI